MKKKELLTPLLMVGVLVVFARAQQRERAQHQQQTEFSMEQEIVPIKKALTPPEAALRTLERQPAVSSCLESENSSNGQLPASWFVASEIHLAGPDESDLIVLPAELKAPVPMRPAPNACFIGPYTSKFWVLRKMGEGYQVVLSVDAHDVKLRPTRWRGYRDIETSISNLRGTTTTLYRFDGDKYRLFRQTTKPKG